MSLLTAINFLEIQNGKTADQAARELDDLKDEAQQLQNHGVDVMSWHDFKHRVVQEKPKYMQNAALGACVGAALLGGLTLLTGPIAPMGYMLGGGALFGGIAGGYRETENSQHYNKVAAYSQYLKDNTQRVRSMDILERIRAQVSQNPNKSLINGLAPNPEVSPEAINASKTREKGHGCGCGH